MNIVSTTLLFLTFLLAAPGIASRQDSVGLTALGDSVISSIQVEKSDWKYEAVSPITGSADVILQQWTLDSQSIRIAIISHGSSADASRVMAGLSRNGNGQQDVGDLGDEAFSWGRNSVSFRRRNLTVDISAVTTNPTLDVIESSNRRADEHKLCKEFARIVANAIKEKN